MSMCSRGGVWVVSDHNDGLIVLGIEPFEQIQYLPASVDVEISGRLVGQEQAGFVYQGAGNCGSLLLSAGQLAGPVIGAIGQAQLSQDIQGLLAYGGSFG